MIRSCIRGVAVEPKIRRYRGITRPWVTHEWGATGPSGSLLPAWAVRRTQKSLSAIATKQSIRDVTACSTARQRIQSVAR